MLKIFTFLAIGIATIFATEEIQQLEQQLAQLHERTSAAGRFAQLAKFVIDNPGKATESNQTLQQQFAALNQSEQMHITLYNVATSDDATTARAYYLGVRNTLFAAEIVSAFEIMALQASMMDDEQQIAMNEHFSQTFDGMKELLIGSNLGISTIEKQNVSSKEKALAAYSYYRGVKDNLLGRVEAMAKGELFG